VFFTFSLYILPTYLSQTNEAGSSVAPYRINS
jgi:hypothetical protein